MSEEAKKINTYSCTNCGYKMITINRDEGTTPFMIECDKCGSDSYSCWYRCDQNLEPQYEWYKPMTTSERKKLTSEDVKDHVSQGGLLFRKLLIH